MNEEQDVQILSLLIGIKALLKASVVILGGLIGAILGYLIGRDQ